MPRLLRPPARPAGRVRLRAHGRAGGARLQQLRADAVRTQSSRRARQRQPATHDALLPDRLHAAAGAAGRARRVARVVPAREPHRHATRLRHRRRLPRAGPLPRLQRRRARDRSGQLVRRRRGEGVPRRRHRPADDLRYRARGLRRQRVGARRARGAVRRHAAEHRARAVRTPTSSVSTGGTCPTRSCSSASCG